MNLPHPYNKFFELEKDMGMFHLEINGINYWQLMRFQLLKKISTKDSKTIKEKEKISLIRVIASTMKASIIHHRNRSIKKPTDILMLRPCISVNYKNKLNDHQYDYCFLPEEIKCENIWTLSDYHTIPKYANYNLSQAELKLIFWKIKRKLIGVDRIKDKNLEKVEQILNRTQELYDIDIDMKEIVNKINYSIALHTIYTEEFEKIFDKFTPKIILVYPHYDEHMFAAIAAAKRMGIKSIEFQHGRINDHEAYYYQDITDQGKCLPNYLFTYGKWWNEKVKMPVSTHLLEVGNCFLEYEMRKEKNILSIAKKKTIAVFSGPETGVELSEFIMKCLPYFEANNYIVYYKFHPRECNVWKKEYPKLKQSGCIHYIDDESVSVYHIIANANYLISISTTCLFEALAFQNRLLLVLKRGNYKQMMPLIEMKKAQLINTEQDLIHILADTYQSVAETMDPVFFEKNAQYNTVQAIKKILKSNE